jgi:hypothetical protein
MVELSGRPVANCPIRVPIDRDPNAADPSKSWAEHLNEPTTIEPVKLRIHAVRPDGKPMTKVSVSEQAQAWWCLTRSLSFGRAVITLTSKLWIRMATWCPPPSRCLSLSLSLLFSLSVS